MKRFILALSGLLLISVLNAQSLEEIVKKYSVANKLDKINTFSTIKLTAKMSMMGTDMSMELWMKNPNKVRSVTNFMGQQMISVFDGVKGYSINPMSGSSTPVEMTPEQVKQTLNSNMFQNSLLGYLKDGKLTLEGEDKVNDMPVYKLKADLGGGNSIFMFIDKASFLQVKTSAAVNTNGQAMTIDVFMSDYKEVNGVFLPMKTNTSAGGMDIVMTFDKVEVNIPMEDSLFTVK
jgi:hypothetical protein